MMMMARWMMQGAPIRSKCTGSLIIIHLSVNQASGIIIIRELLQIKPRRWNAITRLSKCLL